MTLTKAIEINALVKALNMLIADEDRLLQIAAHLTTLPGLRMWRIGVRGGRIVADTRPVVPVPDQREALQDLLNMASTDDAALMQAAEYLQTMPWYAGKWVSEAHEGMLVLRAVEPPAEPVSASTDLEHEYDPEHGRFGNYQEGL